MERVAFLIEQTGERIECLLNPESFTLTRQAGVRPQRTLSGVASGTAVADDPLLATGGGSTALELELLFDLSKLPAGQTADSVQTLTAPLWDLAENSSAPSGYGTPPRVRFVWGKSWNIPAIVVSVAERFEHFTPEGVPRRSWMTMRLIRCAEPTVEAPPARAGAAPEGSKRAIAPLPEAVPAENLQVHEVQGGAGDEDGAGVTERMDQLAQRYLGDASLWRLLAEFNGIDDPGRLAPGTSLMVPPVVSSR